MLETLGVLETLDKLGYLDELNTTRGARGARFTISTRINKELEMLEIPNLNALLLTAGHKGITITSTTRQCY